MIAHLVRIKDLIDIDPTAAKTELATLLKNVGAYDEKIYTFVVAVGMQETTALTQPNQQLKAEGITGQAPVKMMFNAFLAGVGKAIQNQNRPISKIILPH